MCQIMEELNAKAEKRRSLQIASSFLEEGNIPIEKIAKCCKLTLDEVRELAENRNKLS